MKPVRLFAFPFALVALPSGCVIDTGSCVLDFINVHDGSVSVQAVCVD